MGVFFWSLELGGLSIALVGLAREHWLSRRSR